jgi:hypothetical protein
VKFHDGSPLTTEDIKDSYDRIINPPKGLESIRKAYNTDLDVSAPDPATVVFKLKNPMAGVLEALASPYNCIYSAAKLKQNPRYPETEIMGSGAFTFVEHVKARVGPASASMTTTTRASPTSTATRPSSSNRAASFPALLAANSTPNSAAAIRRKRPSSSTR